MWTFPVLLLLITFALSFPAGLYLARVMDGRYRSPAWLGRLERRLDTGPQTWKQYAIALLTFNTLMFVVAFALLAGQASLPLNPDGKGILGPTTVFNTAISFQSNTSLQHYAGEKHLSYLSQLAVVGWNMFVSGATGLCTAAAFIRGLRGDPYLGNFYLDLWRGVAYVLVPASLLIGVPLIAAGTPMTFQGAAQARPVDPGAMGLDTQGGPRPQTICRGPVGALVPIKHLGSVGGGWFGVNSAHPFENPSCLSDFLSCFAMLILPAAVVVAFGKMLNAMRQAWVLYGAAVVLLIGSMAWAVYWDAARPNPALADRPAMTLAVADPQGNAINKDAPPLAALPVDSEGWGNLEGKELRLGRSAGATFAAVTTAVACGSMDCSHDSLNPLAGLSLFVGMWLNCVLGGKGIGLINLVLYLLLAVFLGGLMVGRTPEYLGRKVEEREMKLAMLALLIHPVLILGPASVFAVAGWAARSVGNPGAHGFSEVVYEFSSSAANNGSEFSGLQQTWGFNAIDPEAPPAPCSPQWDVATGLVMLLARFVPIVAALALAGSLSQKPATPATAGTLRTDTLTFGIFLVGIILLVGALLFLPAVALGPLNDHFGPRPFGG